MNLDRFEALYARRDRVVVLLVPGPDAVRAAELLRSFANPEAVFPGRFPKGIAGPLHEFARACRDLAEPAYRVDSQANHYALWTNVTATPADALRVALDALTE